MDIKKYGNIEVKKDCKMYVTINEEEGTCKGLNDLYCKREKCNFYKPTETAEQ